jgi:pimeloyl-ACP methyl ester carboxylesterase
MNKYGIGIIRENFSMTDFMKDILFFKGYTFSEKINYSRGSLFSLDHLWDNVIDDNLFESSTSFQVPIFLTHGKWDYQVSYTLAREWFDKIDAPEKAFFSFENSAHSPNMEEPEKFVQIIRKLTSERK